MLRATVRNIIVLIAGIVVGFALLLFVYSLPTNVMRSHLVDEEEELINNWDAQEYPGRENARNDATDYHMLAIAAFEGGQSLVDRALSGHYRIPADIGDSLDQLDLLQGTLDPSIPGTDVSYARYWHGYLVPLKLQLLVMDYYSIRLVNSYLLLSLFVVFIVLLVRRRLERFVPAYTLAFLLGSPVTVSLNMEYYPCYYNALLLMIFLLLFYERIREHDETLLGTAFLVTGIVTAYVDFLTFPVLTVAMPLMLLAILSRESTKTEELPFRTYLACCIWWAVGYAVMWSSKWVIAFIFLGPSMLHDLFDAIELRSSSSIDGTTSFSYSDVLKANWDRIVGSHMAKAILAIFGTGNAAYLIQQGRRGRLSVKGPKTGLLVTALCMLMPFAWAFVLKNHTYMHSYFTYRTFTAAILALSCLPPFLVKPLTPVGRHFS